MTKKDFIAIAVILRRHHATPEMVKAFADYCATKNSLFDYGRFRAVATWRVVDAED